MKRQTPEEIRCEAIEECATMVENYASLWSNLPPDQSKQIASFFARNLRELKVKAEPIGVPPQALAQAAAEVLKPVEDVASGCIGVCSTLFDPVCKGCGRLASDVDQWVFLNRDERIAAVAAAKERLKTMQK
jgi:predicted Fe-S protein YdhL (DUF1289 family)